MEPSFFSRYSVVMELYYRVRNLFRSYQVMGNAGPELYKFERLPLDTAWGKIYEWILVIGPLQIRKWATWKQ